jgi:hypothetical protein
MDALLVETLTPVVMLVLYALWTYGRKAVKHATRRSVVFQQALRAVPTKSFIFANFFLVLFFILVCMRLTFMYHVCPGVTLPRHVLGA